MSADLEALRRLTIHVGGEPRLDTDRAHLSVGEVRAILAALERIPELEREEHSLTMARDYWRERAERVEAAAREVVGAFGAKSRYFADAPWTPKIQALKALRAALAAAPAEEGRDG